MTIEALSTTQVKEIQVLAEMLFNMNLRKAPQADIYQVVNLMRNILRTPQKRTEVEPVAEAKSGTHGYPWKHIHG